MRFYISGITCWDYCVACLVAWEAEIRLIVLGYFQLPLFFFEGECCPRFVTGCIEFVFFSHIFCVLDTEPNLDFDFVSFLLALNKHYYMLILINNIKKY